MANSKYSDRTLMTGFGMLRSDPSTIESAPAKKNKTGGESRLERMRFESTRKECFSVFQDSIDLLRLLHMSDDEQMKEVVVPFETLSKSALRGIVEAHILEEGTFYGEGAEPDLDTMAEHVLQLLKAGKARVVYNAETETASLVLTN
jgi:uncharacterized protein YheU (UPF0270 family)